jgi:dolichyl-diphosphooligosaccharide--protein glycosyltransferase
MSLLILASIKPGFCCHVCFVTVSLALQNWLVPTSLSKSSFVLLALTSCTCILQVVGAAGGVLAAICMLLYPTGYFGPLSARVRGLFVKHTRTGNPLVDSVAEHQPASSQAYWQYLHIMCYFAPIGMFMCMWKRSDSKYFLTLFALVAYYFSIRMMRLILLMAPITSALSGVAIGYLVEWSIGQIFNFMPPSEDDDDKQDEDEDEEEEEVANGDKSNADKQQAANGKKHGKKNGKVQVKDVKEEPKKKEEPSSPLPKIDKIKSIVAKKSKKTDDLGPWVPDDIKRIYRTYLEAKDQFDGGWASSPAKLIRMFLSLFILVVLYGYCSQFNAYSQQMSWGMSNPSIMFKAQLRNGQYVIIDDYREAYWWLRDNTPPDSRVMAWWDYGYQIAGIANRITIADGNTWNHEHIATLGKCLSSEESAAHKIVRHLADYVLVWTGGGGDDLAKSPHMARIGNSVYHDICPGDPTCRQFGFVDRQGTPTPMMAASLLYKLHSHNQKPGVHVNPELFREVYTSKYNKVRIYKVLKVSKKSRKWLANPANRICDAPGSWYCVGQYPPALDELIANRTSFKQLEDFNTKRTAKDDEYTREYMRRMEGGGGSGSREKAWELEYAPSSKESAEWADTPLTTKLWNLVHGNKVKDFRDLIRMEPNVVHVRSGDGRGPLWWAYEYGRGDIVNLLLKSGSDPNAIDSRGKKPSSMFNKKDL